MDKKNILIPIIIFAVFAGLYLSITIYNKNDLLFRPVWDIDHYRSIAEEGYVARPCDPARDYPIGEVCGNVGWFPAWPAAVKILSLGQVRSGMMVLPYLFSFLGFIIFYNILRRLSNDKAALIGTIALAATPTAFYFLTGFPYSLMLFLFGAYLYYLYASKTRGRAYMLPVLAFFISLSYPSAFIMAIIPLVMLVNRYRKTVLRPHWQTVTKDIAYYILPFALGPLLLSLYFYIKFDDFLLMLHFQEKYDRQWGFPLTVIRQSLKHFQFQSDAHFMDSVHTCFLANFSIIWYGLIFFIFFPYRIKPELTAYFLALYLFSPATGSVISIWRHFILLFPAAMIIAVSPRPRWIKLAYIALGLLLALFIYYPKFMKGYLI